jgi:outer membrane immunogenic protein
LGPNYQFGSFVAGVEGDFDWFANNNNSATVTAFGTTLTGGNNGRWLTTLTGRLGYAADHVLFCGKGGGAWVGSNNFTVTNVATGPHRLSPTTTRILMGLHPKLDGAG